MVRRGVGFLVVMLIVLSLLNQNLIRSGLDAKNVPEAYKFNELSYVYHEPFNITSDADFETQSWPGNGSQSNPYIIETLNITTNSSACIWVVNTTSHFIIQNCMFMSPVCDYSGYQPMFPITLTNVTNGVLRGNRVVNSSAGISGFRLSTCHISDNRFNVTSYAISIMMSNLTTIFNNTQESDPCHNGMSLNQCRNCTVSLNLFGKILSNGIIALSTYNSSFIQNTLIASDDEMDYPWNGIHILGGGTCIIRSNEIANFWQSGIEVIGYGHLAESNNVSSNQRGILLSTINSVIRSNNLTDNFNSIEIVNSNETNVYDNTIRGKFGRYDCGIMIHGGSGCEIYSNIISNVGYGIIVQGAKGFNISDNIVNRGRYGFAFGWYGTYYPSEVPDGPSSDCDIIDNSFDSGGLLPSIENYGSWDFNTIHFLGNTVNGRPIGFYAYLDDSEIDGEDYGQLSLVSCTSVRITGGNFYGVCSDVGEDLYYDPGQAAAITLINCSYSYLEDISFHDNTIGVAFQQSYYCNLWGGSGYNNSWAAMILWYSHHCYIVDVHFRNNLKGVALGWSWSCSISDCFIWENDEAVYCVGSPSCVIDHNTVFQNGDAILLIESNVCQIWSNTIYWNSRGILLNSSSDCLITENNVYNNTGAGICLDRTSNLNEIYDNVFAYNTPNAICEGFSNHWDDQVDSGNWWSDYSGEGPYDIDENDWDNFPIDNRTATTPSTTIEPWKLDPLILGISGGVIGMVLLAIIVIDRRRVVIGD